MKADGSFRAWPERVDRAMHERERDDAATTSPGPRGRPGRTGRPERWGDRDAGGGSRTCGVTATGTGTYVEPLPCGRGGNGSPAMRPDPGATGLSVLESYDIIGLRPPRGRALGAGELRIHRAHTVAASIRRCALDVCTQDASGPCGILKTPLGVPARISGRSAIRRRSSDGHHPSSAGVSGAAVDVGRPGPASFDGIGDLRSSASRDRTPPNPDFVP